ncbi:MAG: alpha/beta hydrolase [Bdellovibrionales bacterium]|nr:alpha/beta hydrolase [Ramlibacter sp.]
MNRRLLSPTLAITAVAAGALLLTLNASAKDNTMSQTGTKYKADADMQSVLDALGAMNPKPMETLEPAEARKGPTPTDAVMAILKQKGKSVDPQALVPGVTSKDTTLPGPAGSLPVRIYTPEGQGPFPIVVYFHGGGWVIASKEVYDGGARGLARQAQAVVVSVDYRLAPEAKFPAQHDDALATYKWAAQNAASINGDPKRMALAGESAGGNLAMATAIAVRDQGLTPPLHVVTVYPVAQASNLSTPSYIDSATAKPLNKPMMEWFARHTLGKDTDKKDPRIDLLHANLKGLPPVTLINAQIDPLRSDGDMLADALKKAGVKVEHKMYPGTTHEFFGMAAVVADAKDAQALAGRNLKRAFEGK